MKKLNIILLGLAILSFLFVSKSCLPDTYYGADPIEGTIVRFYFDNSEATVIMGTDTIYATLPRNTDLKTLVPVVLVSLGTEFIDFEPMKPTDFTNPVTISLKGTDGVVNKYVIIAEIAEAKPGFAEVKPLFEIRHEELPDAKANELKSIAVSGDKLVLLTKTNILYFDALSGKLMGNLGKRYSLNLIASDSLGRILGTNAVNKDGTMKIFRMNSVEEAPIEIYSGINTNDGQYGNGAQMSVYGDIEKNAVIFTPFWRGGKSSNTNRWVIESGKFTTSSPELIEYIYNDPAAKPYGNIGFAMSEGANAKDGYVFGDRAESSYFKEGVRYILNPADIGLWTYGGPGGGKIFYMNGAKYLALWRSNLSHGGLFNIMDITNPAAIAMSKEDRARNRIQFLQYESETFRHFSGFGTNVSMVGGIDVKYLENGNVILYFMYDNAGIKAYELIKDMYYEE